MSKQTQVISQLIAYFISNGTLTAAEIAKLESEGFIDEPRIISPVYVEERRDRKTLITFWVYWPHKNQFHLLEFLRDRRQKHYDDGRCQTPYCAHRGDGKYLVKNYIDPSLATDTNYHDWFESTTNLARK